MKSFKAAGSFLLLSSASAFADNTIPPSSDQSLPIFASMTDGTKPAVDGVNGKLTAYGGVGQANSFNIAGIPGLSPAQSSSVWKGAGGAIGTISVPIGHSFGAQLDLGSGAFGSSPLGNATGHLFWRNPDKGLVGAYGSGLLLGNSVGRSVWTAAGEFEAYFGNVTGRAIIGVQGSNANAGGINGFDQFAYFSSNPASNNPNYFTDIVTATFYPIDDLALSVGHVYSFGRNAVTGEVEYLLPQFRGGNIAPSAFVMAGYGCVPDQRLWDKF